MNDPVALPLELTAPLIQRIAREGLVRPLSDAERLRLCECVLFHVDRILEQCRVPKVGSGRGTVEGARRS